MIPYVNRGFQHQPTNKKTFSWQDVQPYDNMVLEEPRAYADTLDFLRLLSLSAIYITHLFSVPDRVSHTTYAVLKAFHIHGFMLSGIDHHEMTRPSVVLYQ